MDACNNKMMVNNHRDKLENYIRKLESSKTSPVITAKKYNEIVAHLKAPNDKVDPHFKSWVKNRNFQLMSLPGLGIESSLFVPNKKQVCVKNLINNN